MNDLGPTYYFTDTQQRDLTVTAVYGDRVEIYSAGQSYVFTPAEALKLAATLTDIAQDLMEFRG